GFDAAWANVGSVGPDPAELWSRIVSAVAATVSDGDRTPALSIALAQRSPVDTPQRLTEWARPRTRQQVIVLDDFEGVTAAELHEQLLSLIALAPSTLHLVFLCRHDPPWPLHRMRADGVLIDIRGDVLAFNDEEAAELFTLLDFELGP